MMVSADKNSVCLKNGQRSRGPSPNGSTGPAATQPPSPSSVDDDGEKIRVGRDYQAVCPEMLATETAKKPVLLQQDQDRALLVWSPSGHISDDDLDSYMKKAKEDYGYNGEQALGMLFWHKHDLKRATEDLANFTPFPDEWTAEDKVLFEQAITYYGKAFHRIKTNLPDKNIASLVKYYYTWKKSRVKTSQMDKQAAKKNASRKEEASEHGSEQGSNPSHSDSDPDEIKPHVQSNKQLVSSLKRKASDTVDELRGTEGTKSNARWTSEELSLAVQGVRKYGKNFKAIAEIVGTKTEQHIRTFFVTHRKRYNLDAVLAEYEQEHGIVPAAATAAPTNTSSAAAAAPDEPARTDLDVDVISEVDGGTSRASN